MRNKVTVKIGLSTPDFKVLDISGEIGSELKKHKVNENALLIVRIGVIAYEEENCSALILKEGTCHNIPSNVYHQVTCIEKANFFVVLTNHTKMKFENES